MGKFETLPGTTHPLDIEYKQLATHFDPEYGIMWATMNPTGVPCFNIELLRELQQYHQSIENCDGTIWMADKPCKISYAVAMSKIPGVFNLGGDLALIVKLIKNRDRESLSHYATKCIDSMASRINHCGLPLVTISLVQGDALGGGFEAALTSDIIIAERSSKLGFPEILFNLFPGMGAYSFVARKIGAMQAERIIMSGKMYSAEELHEIGLVDVLVEDGDGEDAVYDYVRRQYRRSNGYLALQMARQRFNPVTYHELMDIATIWVDAALKLRERDIKVMERFISSQNKQFSLNDRRLRSNVIRHDFEMVRMYLGEIDRRRAPRAQHA